MLFLYKQLLFWFQNTYEVITWALWVKIHRSYTDDLWSVPAFLNVHDCYPLGFSPFALSLLSLLNKTLDILQSSGISPIANKDSKIFAGLQLSPPLLLITTWDGSHLIQGKYQPLQHPKIFNISKSIMTWSRLSTYLSVTTLSSLSFALNTGEVWLSQVPFYIPSLNFSFSTVKNSRTF